MYRPKAAAIALITLILPALGHADFPTNPGFEEPSGWTALGTDDAPRFVDERPVRGKRCLALRGWAVSEPAGTSTGGWLRLRLSAQPVDAEACGAQLALAFVTTAEAAPHPQLIIEPTGLPGRGWRQIEAEVFAPTSPELRLALGAIGEGEWLVDEVSVQPIAFEAPRPAGDVPVYAQPLPPGWEPEGTLDAVGRQVVGEAELVVTVGGIEVGAPARITHQRGLRGGLSLSLVNRSGVPKSLTVSVSGPAGVQVPERTIPVRPAASMVFKMSAQAPLLGEQWLRVELRSGDEAKALPVRLTSTPGYPAPTAVFSGEPPTVEDFAVLTELGVGICQVAGAPDELATTAQALPPGAQFIAMVAPPWSGEAVDATVVGVGGRASFMSLYVPPGSALPDDAVPLTSHLAAALRSAGGTAWTLSPPLDVDPTAAGADLSPATEPGAAGLIACAGLRLPPLQPATVRALSLNRKPWAAPVSAWTGLAQQTDLTPAADAIRAQARLPLLVSELCASGSGSPELDALSLARVMVTSAYQGTTGLGLYARPEDCPPGAAALSLLDESGAPRPAVAEVFATLGRELSSALPLQVLQQDERVGLSPSADISYRPFLQGDQGVVALWNNTGDTADVFVELRATPLDILTIEIGPTGMTRTYSPIFRFSQEAHDLGLPFIPVTLPPGQMTVLSMQLMNPYVAWLASVYYRPEMPRRGETQLEEFLRRIEESRGR